MDRQALENMLEQGADNPLLRYTLGTLCLKAGEPENAVMHLQEGLRQDESHSASWKFYAKELAELGRLEEARNAYEKGILIAESKGDIQAVKEMKVFLKRISV